MFVSILQTRKMRLGLRNRSKLTAGKESFTVFFHWSVLLLPFPPRYKQSKRRVEGERGETSFPKEKSREKGRHGRGGGDTAKQTGDSSAMPAL